MFLFSVFLFFILTPNILVSLPPKGNKYTVALVHSIIFGIVWHLTHKGVWHLTEGFDEPQSQAADKASQQIADAIKALENASATTKKA